MMLLPGTPLDAHSPGVSPSVLPSEQANEWSSNAEQLAFADHMTDPTGRLVTDDLDTMLDEALRLSREEMDRDTARREEHQVQRESLDDMLAQIGQQEEEQAPATPDREGDDLELRAALELSKRQHEDQEQERQRRLQERQKDERRLYSRLMDEQAEKEISSLQAPGMKSSSSEAVLSRPISRSSRGGTERPSSRGGLSSRQKQPVRNGDLMNDLAEMSGAKRTSNSRPQSEGELIGLDDLDGWNKGSGLFGVNSMLSTYPSKPLPIMPPRQSAPMSPAHFGASDGRPASKRAGRNGGGPGLSSSSSTPLLAAAALSIS